MLVVFFGSFYLINLMLAVVATSYEQEAGSGGDEDDDEDDEDEDEDVSANRPTLIECSLPGHRVFYGVY